MSPAGRCHDGGMSEIRPKSIGTVRNGRTSAADRDWGARLRAARYRSPPPVNAFISNLALT